MIRCAVVGASGYAGAELTALLAHHPDVRLESVHADSRAGQPFEAIHPRLRHRFRGELQPFEADRLAGLDAVFLALPHGVSAATAARLAGRVGTLIDLSGDLRLADAATYRRWYGHEHPAPELLGRAAYGLPELFGAELAGAELIACAGCYATAVQLAAAPLVADRGRGPGGSALAMTACALSGTSGGGRNGGVPLSFSEVGGNARAYRLGSHQHTPEIVAGLERISGRSVRVTFVPSLIPTVRGILATVVAPLPAGAASARELVEIFTDWYDGAPFVRVADPAVRPAELQDVVGTNFCDISPAVDEEAGTSIVVAALDNLLKGAAGQAVQVLNRVFQLPETAGLPHGPAPGSSAAATPEPLAVDV